MACEREATVRNWSTSGCGGGIHVTTVVVAVDNTRVDTTVEVGPRVHGGTEELRQAGEDKSLAWLGPVLERAISAAVRGAVGADDVRNSAQ